jgi:glycosyltransferase involved in cell wall biosynthesis
MKVLARRNLDTLAETYKGRAAELSVIIPIFDEEENILPLHEQLATELQKLGRTYEIVYVDDGSRDKSAERLRQLAESDHHVVIVQFRRNFGQTAALQAGIDLSHGNLLVFMDGDMQNDPRDIGRLLSKLDEGFDVVSGWRKDRHDALLRRKVPSWIANWLISRVTGVRLNDYGCTLKAYRRETLADVRLYGEMHRFMPAYAAAGGAAIAEIPVAHHARLHGRSKYGLWRTFRVLLDLLTVKLLGSYSTKPIYFFGGVGFVLWTLALIAAAIVVIQKLTPPYPYAHNNPLLLLAVFLAIVGVQFVMMGLLAEIAIRTYHESQNKPTYVVRTILEPAPAPESTTAAASRSRAPRES